MAKSNSRPKSHTCNPICSTTIRSSDKTPSIRLHGKWLESAGFLPGQLVHVIVKNGCIILMPENDNLLSFLLEIT